jgi:hypothetical protein
MAERQTGGRHDYRPQTTGRALSEDYLLDDFEFALDLLAIISYPRAAITPAPYVG